MTVAHRLRLRLGVLTFVLALVPPAPSWAAKLLVANDGTDAPGCGQKNAACRTIGVAIAAAAPGDTILVGPGHYGDLDHDGASTFPDEEHSGTVGCLIVVDKPLVILSSTGAAATVVDAGGSARSVFCLTVGGTVLGKPKKGFTVTGAGGTAVGVYATLGAEPTGATIAGNRAIGNAFGIAAYGSNVLRGNEVIGSTIVGISVTGTNVLIEKTLVSGTAQDGIDVLGGNAVVRDVVIAGSQEDGIQLNGDGRIERTIITGTKRWGILGAGGNVTVVDSAVIGNGNNGILNLNENGIATVTITHSNLFANGLRSGGDPSMVNCGVRNEDPATMNAAGNYWGSASGPGDDPGDFACVKLGAGNVTLQPILTKPRKVTPKLLPPG